MASASVGDAYQDGMLAGSDFFDTGANPAAEYRSTEVTSLGPGRYSARGTLAMKGKSAPQSINFTLSGTGDRRVVKGTGVVQRTLFGVGSGESAQGIDTSVTVDFSFTARATPSSRDAVQPR